MQVVRYYGAGVRCAWGMRLGDSICRYCASLGHVADDEPGLVYMRARYYEPSSGRFVSEDSNKEGPN